MSSSIWFPDNVKRRDRLQGLIDNISNDQRDAAAKYDSMKLAEDNMLAALEALRKQAGLASLKDLQDKIVSELPPEAQEEMKKAIKNAEIFEQVTDTITMVSGIAFGAAITAGIVVNAVQFFKAVPVLRSMFQIARGFKIIITEGIEAGVSFLRTTVRSLKILMETAELGETLTKVLNVVGKVATVVSYISLGIEIFTLIAQIIEEAKQRDKLIENIHVAQPARIAVSYFKDQAEKSTENSLTMQVYVQMYAKGQAGDAASAAAAQALASALVPNMIQANNLVTVDGVIKAWDTIDTNTNAYRGADLSQSDLKAKVQADIDQFEQEAEAAAKKDQ